MDGWSYRSVNETNRGCKMTGYEYIRHMPDSKISKTFGVGELAAVNIRNASLEQMKHSTYICPQFIKKIKHKKYKCRYSEEKCPNCLQEFLESEVEEVDG
jgi:hypothetical protein